MPSITAPMPSGTGSIERHRPILAVATFLLAFGAAVLATVAIATDDVGSTRPAATPVVATIASPNAGTGDPIINELDGGACRLRAITRPCP
jgi:hypothetical protein